MKHNMRLQFHRAFVTARLYKRHATLRNHMIKACFRVLLMHTSSHLAVIWAQVQRTQRAGVGRRIQARQQRAMLEEVCRRLHSTHHHLVWHCIRAEPHCRVILAGPAQPLCKSNDTATGSYAGFYLDMTLRSLHYSANDWPSFKGVLGSSCRELNCSRVYSEKCALQRTAIQRSDGSSLHVE